MFLGAFAVMNTLICNSLLVYSTQWRLHMLTQHCIICPFHKPSFNFALTPDPLFVAFAGKNHYLSRGLTEDAWPDSYDDFAAVRTAIDPQGLWMNSLIQLIFGGC